MLQLPLGGRREAGGVHLSTFHLSMCVVSCRPKTETTQRMPHNKILTLSC